MLEHGFCLCKMNFYIFLKLDMPVTLLTEIVLSTRPEVNRYSINAISINLRHCLLEFMQTRNSPFYSSYISSNYISSETSFGSTLVGQLILPNIRSF